MKSVEFCLIRDTAYINSLSITTMKLGMSTGPFIKIKWTGINDEEKLKLILEAFAGCKEDVPIPDNPEKYSKLSLKPFGFSNWKIFARTGLHCMIEYDIEQYHFIPLIYSKKDNALYASGSTESIVASATAEKFIGTLVKTLEKIPELTEMYYHKEAADNE